MQKEEVIKLLEEILHDEETLIELHYVNKIKQEYKFCKIELSNNLQKHIKNLISSSIKDFISTKELLEYNPITAPDETIEYICSDDVPGLNIYTECRNNDKNITTKLTELDKIYFYALDIYFKNQHITFFKRYSIPAAIKDSVILGLCHTGYKEIKNNLIFIYKTADLILLNNQFIIFSRYAFEIIMNYKDNFFINLDKALNEIKKSNVLVGFQQFENDCKNSIRIAKKFTQTIKKGNLAAVIKNKSRIPLALNSLLLDIKFDEKSQQIIYDSPSQLNTIVTIFSDGFAKTLINERNVAIELEQQMNKDITN